MSYNGRYHDTIFVGNVIIDGKEYARMATAYEEKFMEKDYLAGIEFGKKGRPFSNIDIIVTIYGRGVSDDYPPEKYTLSWLMNNSMGKHTTYLYEINANDLNNFNGNDAGELYKIIFKNKSIDKDVEDYLRGKIVHFVGELLVKKPDNGREINASDIQSENSKYTEDEIAQRFYRKYTDQYFYTGRDNGKLYTNTNKNIKFDTNNALTKNVKLYKVANRQRPIMFPPKGISQGGRTKRSKRTKHHTKKR
jgi:hypothetical protein